mmetsp:Transcript_1749/g.5631  ORF Transcript_1749/g.5631 Transcript_1749/m.5631 type:complete len:462 (-) Transcript_1749:29-1414(-)
MGCAASTASSDAKPVEAQTSKDKQVASNGNDRLFQAYERISTSCPWSTSTVELHRLLDEAAADICPPGSASGASTATPSVGPTVVVQAHVVQGPWATPGFQVVQPNVADVFGETNPDMAEVLAAEEYDNAPAGGDDGLQEAVSLPPFEGLRAAGLLGCGGFGYVELVQHGQTGRWFARKCMSKGYIVKTGMQRNARIERLVLSIARSPFIASYYGSYSRDQHLYLMMEPLLGGELYHTYARLELHGSEAHARYYVACVCLALQHLHRLRVLCRGVKPEDCVLDRGGRLKLCDFGLSKPLVARTYTTAGTPDYFAPETIRSTGHGFPVDWWCTGVLLFELLSGHPPFESGHPMQIYSKVMHGIDRVNFPKAAQPAKALIKALMHPAPDQRLPVQPEGMAKLKGHPWFAGFSWRDLEGLTLAPPRVPDVRSPEDLSNFNAKEADKPMNVPYTDPGDGWDSVFG